MARATRLGFFSWVGAAMVAGCFRAPDPRQGGHPAAFRLEVQVFNGRRLEGGSLEVTDPTGARLWTRRLQENEDEWQLMGWIPFTVGGDYHLRAYPSAVGDGPPRDAVFTVRDVSDEVEAILSRPWRPGSFDDAMTAQLDGRVWAHSEAGVELRVLGDPARGEPGTYVVRNLGEQDFDSKPMLWPHLVRSGQPREGPQWRWQGVVRGTTCGPLPTGRPSSYGPGLKAHASAVLHESQALCNFVRLAPGEYEQLVWLHEAAPAGEPYDVARFTRTLELSHRFRVDDETPVPAPRRVFADVPVAQLRRTVEKSLLAPDGGTDCVCVGARVGREALRAVKAGGFSVVLATDGGSSYEVPLNVMEAP